MRGTTQKNWPRILVWALIVIPSLVALQIAILLAGFLVGAYAYFARDLPTVADLERYEPRVPVFSSNQEVGSREPKFMVDMDHVPSHLTNAFLAATDPRFLKSGSADPANEVYCFLTLSLPPKLWPRKTCTDCWQTARLSQYVARMFLIPAQYPMARRKIRQLILAIRLERTWGRKKVLWVYLNQVYLGKGCHGVGEAADYYFGKRVEQLSVAEAALIAGISQRPVSYNPMTYPDLADKRKQYVLKTMMERDFLSPEEYEKAKAEPLQFVKR
jgi:penicillin-binding protein 1A